MMKSYEEGKMRNLEGQTRAAPVEDDAAAPEAACTDAAKARLVERREIARELHDTVVQPLTALLMSLENVQRSAETRDADSISEAQLASWKALAREAMQSLRGTMSGLRTQPNGQLSLPEALRRHLVPQIQARGLPVTLQSVAWPADLPNDWTTTLYLTVREALMNVEKHAHASECAVLLRGDARTLSILIVDDGVGFRQKRASQARPTAAGTGFGLGGMRDRVRQLGGRLTISTTLGHGVRLEISVPRARRAPGIAAPYAAGGRSLRRTGGYLH
jgi:signal transduction histidine kinase